MIRHSDRLDKSRYECKFCGGTVGPCSDYCVDCGEDALNSPPSVPVEPPSVLAVLGVIAVAVVVVLITIGLILY